MSTTVSIEHLVHMPGFTELEGIQKTRLQQGARFIHIPKGNTVFAEHAACNDFIFLLKGTALVQKISPEGHEIILYHLTEKHTCGLTASCLMGRAHQHANLIADTPLEIILLTHAAFQVFMEHSIRFKQFVLAAVDRDLNTLIHLMEDISFAPIEERLINKLCEYMKDSTQNPHIIAITHHEMAAELGTAREVISRSLKKLERQGSLKLCRGHIEISQPHKLKALLSKNK